jgi:hypothetical protein
MQLADSEFKQGNYPKAIELYNEFIGKSPQNSP